MDGLVQRPDLGNEYLTDERCHILELSNSAADEALSIARARVEPGVRTALHRLDGTVERYVIIEGEGAVEIGGDAPQRVIAGDVVVIPAGVEQRIANTGRVDLVFLALCTPRFQQENYENLETVDSGA